MIGSVWLVGLRGPTLWLPGDEGGERGSFGDVLLALTERDEDGMINVMSVRVGVRRMYANWLTTDRLERLG